MKKQKGFTLIEILIVIGILAILAAIVIIAINPAQQFAQARNAQRQSDVRSILNAVHQNVIKNRGSWTCTGYPTLPSATTIIKDDGADLCDCLVSDYLAAMPFDTASTTAEYNDCTTYNTAYYIIEESNNRITVSAPEAELGETISVTR